MISGGAVAWAACGRIPAPRAVSRHPRVFARVRADPSAVSRSVSPATASVGRPVPSYATPSAPTSPLPDVSTVGGRSVTRPPVLSGGAGDSTWTYLSNVNVLSSHPSGGGAQKDGRKVRSRDEGTLKFRRVADRRSDAAPAVGLPSTLRASEIPRSHLFSTVQRRLDPESLNLEREDSLMTRRSLRTQRLRSTGGVSRLLVRGVIWSDCIGRRREPLPPAVRGGVVCWSWGSFVAFFLVVGLQLVGLGFVG